MGAILLDIHPFTEMEVNCFDNLISNVMTWKKRNYEMSYYSSWDFAYMKDAPHDMPLSERIILSRGDFWKPLELYHGLKLKGHYESQSVSEKKKVIINELKCGSPVIINIDNFWCPWESAGYQKIHFQHFFLIAGISEDETHFYCVDPVICETIKELPLDHFEKGCNGYITMEFLDSDLLVPVQWKSVVSDAVDRMKNAEVDAFKDMRTMADDLNESIRPEVDLYKHIDNVIFMGLFVKCTEILRGRYRFARLLKFLARECGIDPLNGISDGFIDAGNRWMTFRTRAFSVLKASNPSEYISRAADIIRMIAAMEEKLADTLLQISDGCSETHHAGAVARDVSAKSSESVHFLETSQFFNNRGFANVDTVSSDGGFDNNGSYYRIGENPPAEFLEAGGMAFHLTKPDGKGYDNISCSGQEVSVPSLGISKIWVLGAANCRDFSEQMEVAFADGSTELVQLEFSHWWECISGLHETIAWEGNCIKIERNTRPRQNEKVYLFAKSLPVRNCSLEAVKIKLPECSSIHVFAVTVTGSEYVIKSF